jgi:hypothetical protein
MPKHLLYAAFAAIPLAPAAAEPALTAPKDTAVRSRPAPRLTPERLARLRHALVGQIAV